MTSAHLVCRAAAIAALSCLAAGTSIAQQAPATGRPALRIAALTGTIRIDGALDEPAWATADSSSEFAQTEPNEGAPATMRTVVRVLADGGSLVIGIRADDPDPSRITRFARDRDANLQNEDHVRIVLDTYLDGRSGYVFAVNPRGARYDALVTNQGEGENSDWDAVWEASANVTAQGWVAEIRIPARSLLFRPGLAQWGLNIQRRVQRVQETTRWASALRNFKVTHMSRAGLLTNVPAFDLGVGLSVRPSVTTGARRSSPAVATTGDADASLDLTQRVGSNSLASLTFNTDFAETEVDTRRTNLTRFPLFFPEKRTFFVEGADIFDFGLGLGGSTGRGSDLLPFFSRRIGLLGSSEVPLNAGGKFSGRVGSSNIGALVVRTRGLDTLGTDNTMGVVRVRQNVLGESSVGVVGTFGDPVGRGNSWLGGSDLTWQTSRFRGDKNFLVGVWGVSMNREDLPRTQQAFGFKIDYPNDLWDIATTYKRIDEAFDPSLGFVPRRGVQIANFNINYQPRPQRPILGLHVRQMNNEFQNTLVTDLDGRWESYRVFMAPINWRLESGDRFEFNVVPTGERIDEAFEIARDVDINPGTYRFNRYRLEAGLAQKRMLSGQVTWWFGPFYSGSLNQVDVTAQFKPSAFFIVELAATHNEGSLKEGSFVQDLVGTRFRFNVSSDLQLSSYVQYDNTSNNVGSNTRLRWSFSPLGELFIVYNHNLSTRDPTTSARDWRFASNQLLVKAQYAFRY